MIHQVKLLKSEPQGLYSSGRALSPDVPSATCFSTNTEKAVCVIHSSLTQVSAIITCCLIHKTDFKGLAQCLSRAAYQSALRTHWLMMGVDWSACVNDAQQIS